MNYKNIALGMVALGGLCIVPAFAGVTDVEGGTVTNKSSIDYHTNVKANGSVHILCDWTDEDGVTHDGWRYTSKESGELHGNISDTNVQNVINEYTNSLLSWVESFRGSASGIKAEGATGYISSYYYKSKNSVDASDDAILVGDVDDVSNAYAGQGTVNKELQVEKHQVYQINVTGTVSPIVLDLDGDGKLAASNGEYLPHAKTFKVEGSVMFDFHGNGFPVASEWIGKGDGLLCRPNADGSVDGPNLFGTANGFANGFDELASLDANNDGELSGAELEGLKVWQDLNCNGVAEASELSSLSDLGITSISVSHNNLVGSYVRNGQTFKCFDWWPSVKDVRRVDMARM